MKKRKNAFTLVEILAVIVILAILLVIAVPKVISIIDDATEATFESTVKVIVSQAEKKRVENEVLGKNEEITCDSVAKLNDIDYERCYISFNGNNASVSIKGSGKFDGKFICHGTKNNVDVVDECPNERVFVEFQNYGNMTNKTGIYKEGTKLVLGTPTKDKAIFLNWQIVKGDSNLTDNNELIIGEKDTVIRGNWQETAILNINLNGGTTSIDQNGVYSVEDNFKLERPVKEGYTFNYWDVVSGSSIVSGDNIVIGNDTEIKAIYTINEYTMTYKLDGGTAINPSSYTIETDTFTLVNPNKTGYTFTGWTGSNGNTPSTSVSISKGSTGNKEYTANYNINTYTINYTLNGGSANNPTAYTVETDTFTLVNPSKTGYTFTGWTGSNGNTPNKSVSISKGNTGNKEYTANYSINTYTINYTLDGGTNGAGNPSNGTYGSTITLTDPSKTGYKFTSWSVAGTGASLNGKVLTIGAGNVTVTANWQIDNPAKSYSCANGSKGSSPYLFTYSGNCTMIDDGNGNWRIKLLGGGTFISSANVKIDLFLVGGGAKGGSGDVRGCYNGECYDGGSGGRGGTCVTKKALTLSAGASNSVTIGGSASASKMVINGTTYSAAGGGGSSGSGCIEFGESSGTRYAGAGGTTGYIYSISGGTNWGSSGKDGGGSGGVVSYVCQYGNAGGSGSANTGGGGGGGGANPCGGYSGGAGGSGIVILRNKR